MKRYIYEIRFVSRREQRLLFDVLWSNDVLERQNDGAWPMEICTFDNR